MKTGAQDNAQKNGEYPVETCRQAILLKGPRCLERSTEQRNTEPLIWKMENYLVSRCDPGGECKIYRFEVYDEKRNRIGKGR